MLIEVIGVNVENKGKYRMATVNYKTDQGKVDAKKLPSFVNQEVFKLLSVAQTGDKFEVKSQKNEKGHWEWVEASGAGKNSSPTSQTYQAPVARRGDFETSEERAKKQVYIVRQSSVSAAIALAELNKAKGPISEEDIINSARVFEQYVFDTGTVDKPIKEEIVE